jgi:hypothetical protein
VRACVQWVFEIWIDRTAVEAIPADLAVVHGPVDQGNTILGAGLGENVADVVVHGALADRQLKRDFLVGEPRGHKLNDLQFTLGKIVTRDEHQIWFDSASGSRVHGVLRCSGASEQDLADSSPYSAIARSPLPITLSSTLQHDGSDIRGAFMLLERILASGRFAVTAEVTPPRGADVTRSLQAAAALKNWSMPSMSPMAAGL